jgi:hypothetical protein
VLLWMLLLSVTHDRSFPAGPSHVQLVIGKVVFRLRGTSGDSRARPDVPPWDDGRALKTCPNIDNAGLPNRWQAVTSGMQDCALL